MPKVFTIGFGQKNLKKFIGLLKEAEVTNVIDIRLNNTSQLAGYAKKDDLQFILNLVGIEYEHEISLAPDKQLLDDYKKKKLDWNTYEERYIKRLETNSLPQWVTERIKNNKVCLLCSEHTPEHCHRRLLAEYIKQSYIPDLEIKHLFR